MKHWFTYPLTSHPYDPEFVSRDGLIRIARAAEAAGFDGMGFTDHPAPSHKWLTAGGHDALDPFVALGVVAATTERLQLIPNIVVLPYRNPFIVAKAAASLDALSGGRFVLSVATGYLRSEYRCSWRRLPAPQRSLRRSDCRPEGCLVPGPLQLRRDGLHRDGGHRQPQAGPPTHLDRRQ